MSSLGRPPAGVGMYNHLLDEDGAFTIEPAVGVRHGFRPVRSLAVVQPYRLATFCLVALSAALLVAVIIVAAQHQSNQPQGGAEESSSSSSALQTQGQNVSTLVASIKKLQQENQQLQQEKQQLQQEKQQLEQEKQQLQQEKQQLQQEKQQLQQEKQQLQQEKQQLQQEKQQLQQEKQQLQQEKQQLQQEKQQLEQEKQQLQQEKQQLQQLQQEKQQLQQEKQQLQQEKQQLQQEKQQLQQEKQQLQQEKAELLSRLGATKGPEVIGQSSGTPPTLLPCPDGWHTFSSSCYMVSKTQRSWSSSKDDCSSKGGHLAIITTAEEQTFVWDLLPRGHWNAFWIGITDKATEDQWIWVDGTPLVGGFWEVGEPNNHYDEDCGYVVKTQVLSRVAIRSWYDAPCSMSCRFICELERGGGANSAATTTTSPQ